MSPSVFSGVKPIPSDEAYAVKKLMQEDPSPSKISLSVGAYRDDDGNPWELPSVREAIARLPGEYEYTPEMGLPGFLDAAQDILFGCQKSHLQVRLTTIQTVAGTHACHIGALLLSRHTKPKSVWISDPSWINHDTIWEEADPGIARKLYPYFDTSTKGFNFEGMYATLNSEAEPGDVVILQACAHNPTGCDPSEAQWQEIADLCRKKGLMPFFDSAYQGFVSGDPDRDAFAVRYFASIPGMEMCVAQSFSKNFGLYGERLGAFHLLASEGSVLANIETLLIRLLRSEVSCSPLFAARIVAQIWHDKALRAQWQADMLLMCDRIKHMRQRLRHELESEDDPGAGTGLWKHITDQCGMFSYTGLSEAEVHQLRRQHGIYCLKSGRLSISGVTSDNVVRIASAIKSCKGA